VRVAASDPLNLVGILTPGPKVPASRQHAVVYRDGMPQGDPAEKSAQSPVGGAVAVP